MVFPQILCQLHDHAKQYDSDEVCHNKRNDGSCTAQERLSNGGRVRVRIIHGLNISHKELTYLLQKSISHQNKVLRACS